MRLNTLFLSFVLVFVLSGCVVRNPATGDYDVMLVTEEEEFEQGHSTASYHIKKDGLYKENKDLTNYYQDLSRALVDVTERSDKPFEFIMLDSEEYNAWAIPGYINMYRGMMPFFENEAQFMSIMAHEAGHITARHYARETSSRRLGDIALMIGATAAQYQGQSQESIDATRNLTVELSKFGFAKFSRKAEYEADRLAARYVVRMGYDPKETSKALANMDRYSAMDRKIYHYFSGGKKIPKKPFYSLLASHPPSKARSAQILKVAASITKTVPFKANRDKYLSEIDGLAFGPRVNPFGVAGRDTIYIPKRRLKLDLPEGFYSRYHAGIWESYNSEKKSKISVASITVDDDVDPEEFLRIEWPRLRNLEDLTIAGYPACTGTFYLVKRSGGFSSKKKAVSKIRMVAIKGKSDEKGKVDSNLMFVLTYQAPTGDAFDEMDEGFMTSAKSFQVLTKKQADQIEPLRVKIHTVKEGETVESLAEKLPFGDLRKDWFLTLNNLDKNAKLVVGNKVKLLVDPNEKLKF